MWDEAGGGDSGRDMFCSSPNMADIMPEETEQPVAMPTVAEYAVQRVYSAPRNGNTFAGFVFFSPTPNFTFSIFKKLQKTRRILYNQTGWK